MACAVCEGGGGPGVCEECQLRLAEPAPLRRAVGLAERMLAGERTGRILRWSAGGASWADLEGEGAQALASARRLARRKGVEAFGVVVRGWIGPHDARLEPPVGTREPGTLLYVGVVGLPVVCLFGRPRGAVRPTLFQQVEGWLGRAEPAPLSRPLQTQVRRKR